MAKLPIGNNAPRPWYVDKNVVYDARGNVITDTSDTTRPLPEKRALAKMIAAQVNNGLILEPAEINTILAALRYYQRDGLGDPANRPDDIHAIACGETDGQEEQISLDEGAIDTLCEKINCGG